MYLARRYINGAKPDALNVAILLLIIFNSGGVTLFNHYYITMATLYLLAIKTLIRKEIQISLAFSAFGFFAVLLLYNFFITSAWSGIVSYVIYFSYIITAIWVVASYRNIRNNFVEDLFHSLKIFLYYSLISFFIQFAIKDFLFPLYNKINTFYYLFYYTPQEIIPFVLRNQGVFWEPGVLQIYMNLLFYIAFFVKKDMKISFLAALAVLSTFSTTGYMILFMLITVAFSLRVRRSYFAAAIMLIVLPIVTSIVFMNVYNKLTGYYSESAVVRMFDFIVGISMVENHPLVGVGMGNERYKNIFYKYGIGSSKAFGIDKLVLQKKGTTNSILFFATVFGIPIFTVLMIFLYKQTLIPDKFILVFFIFIISGLSEPIFNTAFISLFLVSGFSNSIPFSNKMA